MPDDSSEQPPASANPDHQTGLPALRPAPSSHAGRLERLSLQYLQQQLGARLTGGNRIEVLCDGEKAFPAMLEAIRHARDRILFEVYIFRHDRTGVEFYEALLERLRAGVQVYLLYDAFGASEAEELFEDLASRGAHVCIVNPPWAFNAIRRWHRRDHRKILVVDGDLAFTGGINIGNEYLHADGPNHPFRDTHVRIEGPMARKLEEAFIDLWEGQHGTHLKRTHRSAVHAGEMQSLVLAETYRHEKAAMRRLYQLAFNNARRRIWITNSYFVPSAPARRALLRATARGVDVRLLLPGPTDIRVVKWATRSLYPGLLKAGIRIFEYEPRILHAKSVVIDNQWAMVGSTNLDRRSFFYNLEIQALILNKNFTEDLAGVFERDLTCATEITLEDWKKRSSIEKSLYRFFFLFHNWL